MKNEKQMHTTIFQLFPFLLYLFSGENAVKTWTISLKCKRVSRQLSESIIIKCRAKYCAPYSSCSRE